MKKVLAIIGGITICAVILIVPAVLISYAQGVSHSANRIREAFVQTEHYQLTQAMPMKVVVKELEHEYNFDTKETTDTYEITQIILPETGDTIFVNKYIGIIVYKEDKLLTHGCKEKNIISTTIKKV